MSTTQRRRLGVNFNHIPVNAPQCLFQSYHRVDDEHLKQPGKLFRLMTPAQQQARSTTPPAQWAMHASTPRSGTSPIAGEPIRPPAPASPAPSGRRCPSPPNSGGETER
jgi:Catalase